MSKIKRLADLINLLMYTQILAVAGLFLLDALTVSDRPVLLLFAGDFLILSVIWFLRVKIKKMPVFLLGHLLLTAFCIAFCVLVKKDSVLLTTGGLFVALTLAALLFDMLFWLGAVREEKSMPVSETGEAIKGFRPVYREGLPDIHLVFVTVFILGLAYSLYVSYPYFGRVSYVFGVIFTGFFYLRLYLQKMHAQVQNMQRENDDLPRGLLIANAKLGIPLIVLIFLAMFLFQSDLLIGLFDTILLYIARGALWIFLKGIELFAKLPFTEEIGVSVSPGSLGMPEAGESSVLFVILEYLLRFLLLGIFLFLIIRAILRFVRFFSARYINTAGQEDFTEMTEVREKIHGRRKRIREEKPESDPAPAGKIRRLYRRFLNRQRKKGFVIQPSLTPLEHVQPLHEASGRDPEELTMVTSLYDLARYDPDAVSDRDAKKMETLV